MDKSRRVLLWECEILKKKGKKRERKVIVSAQKHK